MISLVALNLRVSRNSGEQTLYNMAKIRIETVSEFFSYDMRYMGYGVQSTFPILEADSNSIRFLVHYDGDENPTEIQWTFDTDASTSYSNPSVRPLLRTVDGVEDEVGVGITQFQLVYLDENRDVLDPGAFALSEIRQIRLNLVAESVQGYGEDRFGRSTWTSEITPFSLN
ncbi:MAG: hypothetical protein WD097_08350 [Balneolales bacterium]